MSKDAARNLIEVKHSVLKQEVRDAFEDKVPLFVWGPPGIGKSDVLREMSEERAAKGGRVFVPWNNISWSVKDDVCEGTLSKESLEELKEFNSEELIGKFEGKEVSAEDLFIFVDYRLATKDAADFCLPDVEGKWVSLKPVQVFHALALKDVEGALFLDELPQAVPMIQNAAFQLIRDRCLGEVTLSKGIAVFAAGNRQDDGGHQFESAPALNNRQAHVELRVPPVSDPSGEDWSSWALTKGVDGRVISFLQSRPSLLMDDIAKVRRGGLKAWASPRTWEMVSKKVAALKSSEVDKIYRKASMLVGQAHAIEFQAFVKAVRKVSVEEILAKPEILRSLDIGELWAALSAIVEWYGVRTYKDFPKVAALVEYLDADFAVTMLRMIMRRDPAEFSAKALPACSKEILEKVTKLGKYFS